MACGQTHTKLVEESTDLNLKVICISCDTKGRETNASVYCVECNKYVCETCSNREHVDTSDEHFMVSRKDFLINESQDKSEDVACDEHPGLVVDMVCVSPHNQVGCNLCMQIHHSGCQLRYITHHMKAINFKSGTHLKEMEAKLASTVDELQAEMTRRMEVKNNVERQKQEARQTIAKTARQLGRMMDDLERRTMEALTMTYENMDNELAQEGLTIEDLIEKIEALERARDANPCEETELALQEAIDQAEKMINENEGGERTLEFIPDTSILDTIRSCDTLLTAHVTGLERQLEDRTALGTIQERTVLAPEEGSVQDRGDRAALASVQERIEATSEEGSAHGIDNDAPMESVKEQTAAPSEEGPSTA
ncbi:protein wech-like [Mya arenaria]|uniref:protein wech-like n=1 Tax=Mya arenaria TaxID=6604 RepID=UPI0022E0FF2B|nr:protein wech-like [Mya arenaria]